MKQNISLGVLALAVGLVGCGSRWQSNAVDLDAVDGAPVRITNARMRHTVTAGVGTKGVTLSSSTEPNAIGMTYDVVVGEAAPEHAGVSGRLVCRVGEHAIATGRGHDASGRLHRAAAGAVLSGSLGEPPSAFHDSIPEVCEAELFYQVQPPLGPEPAPEEVLVSLGRTCLSGGTLRVGPCSDTELPRSAPPGRVGLAAVEGSIGKLADTGTWGVSLTALFTAGEETPDRWQAGAKARCQTKSGEQDVSVWLLVLGHDLRPGESVAGSGRTPSRSGLTDEPERCTVSFSARAEDELEALAEYCLHGDTMDEGPCPA